MFERCFSPSRYFFPLASASAFIFLFQSAASSLEKGVTVFFVWSKYVYAPLGGGGGGREGGRGGKKKEGLVWIR